MPTHTDPAAGRLTSLLLLNARVHGAGAGAYLLARRGQPAVLCGETPRPFANEALEAFHVTIGLVNHALTVVGPIGRLDDAIERIPGPLGDWLSVALLLWIDFQLWAILAALACGFWRRWSRRREAVL